MQCLHVEPMMKSHRNFPCVAHTCVLGSLTNHTDKITMPLHHPKGSSINPKAINRNKLISGCRCNEKYFFLFMALKRMATLQATGRGWLYRQHLWCNRLADRLQSKLYCPPGITESSTLVCQWCCCTYSALVSFAINTQGVALGYGHFVVAPSGRLCFRQKNADLRKTNSFFIATSIRNYFWFYI